MRSNIHQSRFRPVVAADIIVVVRRLVLGLHRARKGVVDGRGRRDRIPGRRIPNFGRGNGGIYYARTFLPGLGGRRRQSLQGRNAELAVGRRLVLGGLRGPDEKGAIRVQRRHPSIAIVESAIGCCRSPRFSSIKGEKSTSKSSCPSLLPLLLPPQSAFRRLIHTTPLSSADDDDGRRTVPEANTILPARPQRHCCWHCRIDARPKSRGPTPRKTTTTSHHANIHR